MNVSILRGIPGCGKSTWVAACQEHLAKFYSWAWIKQNFVRISIDDYHYEDGVYVFKQDCLAEFHNNALRAYLEALQTGIAHIVVDNTNIRCYEIAPYYRLAEMFGCDVTIMQFLADPSLCMKRNIHDVPNSVIMLMAKSIEPIPHWWNVEYITSI